MAGDIAVGIQECDVFAGVEVGDGSLEVGKGGLRIDRWEFELAGVDVYAQVQSQGFIHGQQ